MALKFRNKKVPTTKKAPTVLERLGELVTGSSKKYIFMEVSYKGVPTRVRIDTVTKTLVILGDV